MNNAYDKACRFLLKLDPPHQLLAWFLGLKASDFAFIRWIDTRRLSYPGQPDRTCDTVAHIERLGENRQSWALLVEFNIDPDTLMFGRVLNYLSTLWIEERPSAERGHRFEIGAVVVNLTGVGSTSRFSSWPNAGLESKLLVRERNLAKLQAADVMRDIAEGTVPLTVLPWIPLMQGGNESDIIEKWKKVAASEPVASRRSDFGALAITFAEAVKQDDVWRSALKEWNMVESKFLKEFESKFEDMGRQKEAAKCVLTALQTKFGALPADLPNRLQEIDDLDFLHQLLSKAILSSNLEDFRKQIPNGTLPKP